MPMIGSVITEEQYNKINNLVDRGIFLNRSDFVRTSVRELLEKFSVDEATKRTEK